MARGKGQRAGAGTVKPVANLTEQRKFWSFQPVRKTAPPAVKNQAWAKNPIDAFILAKLEEKHLQPAPPADKVTLLRRATFDLTGLPPTEAEIRRLSSKITRPTPLRAWLTGCWIRRATASAGAGIGWT